VNKKLLFPIKEEGEATVLLSAEEQPEKIVDENTVHLRDESEEEVPQLSNT
jgi:hypothetical protein